MVRIMLCVSPVIAAGRTFVSRFEFSVSRRTDGEVTDTREKRGGKEREVKAQLGIKGDRRHVHVAIAISFPARRCLPGLVLVR